jgi:hypothetical protein
MQLLDPFSAPLRVVAAAVSPVVMVSATALLISTVNNRYTSISNRVRDLAKEHRARDTGEDRREDIRREIVIFRRRLGRISWAARVLYTAVWCFIAVALLISVSGWQQFLEVAALPMFLLGLILIAIAIVLQLIELQESNSTIDIEVSEVLGKQ